MTNAKHTPGPWFVDAEMTEHCCHRSAVCAKVPDGEGMYGNGLAIVAEIWGNENYEANARLIAAAPELLEAVTIVRSIIEEGAQTVFNPLRGSWVERLYASQALLSAAIAKAEGNS